MEMDDFDPGIFEDYDEEDLMRYFEDGEYSPELEQLLAQYSGGVAYASFLLECLQSTFSQVVQNMMTLLTLCFLLRLVCYLGNIGGELGVPRWFLHFSSAVFGVMVLHSFFQSSLLHLFVGVALAYVALALVSINFRHKCGIVVSALIALYIIMCELVLVEKTTWHMIRGAQMIMSMKIISLAFDLESGAISTLPTVFEYLGYCFNVGTVIFGPWIRYEEYATIVEQNKQTISIVWVYKLACSCGISLMCMLYSTCLSQWLMGETSNQWLLAYRDAQSFRFSHYFISYMSVTTYILSGLGSRPEEDGTVKWEKSVVRPLHMEFPRSLVDVVTNWNLPMHNWLKTYVFKSAKPLGNFTAVFLTYAASSLLHGFNFQLSAVLLSLGFYTYTEYVLRNRLSQIFNACIQAKTCKEDCTHKYKYWHPAVITTNVFLALLAAFHLAYLGLMFDSSPEEDKGYTMSHTLGKWSALNYASHWTALGSFIFYFMI